MNCFWQSVTTLADPVPNNFLSERVIMNSNDCLSLTNTGHASTPYKSAGKHAYLFGRQSTDFTDKMLSYRRDTALQGAL